MHEQGMAALWLTTEAEIRYFSGFLTQFWQSPTRPWFLIIKRQARLLAGCLFVMLLGDFKELRQVYVAAAEYEGNVLTAYIQSVCQQGGDADGSGAF